MSLKALARQALERNPSGNLGGNRAENPATLPATPSAPAATVFDLVERAAIVQEGAGVPADWAEGLAKLDVSAVPPWVDGIAWRAMIDAAGRFLNEWGVKAAAAGWTGRLWSLGCRSGSDLVVLTFF